MEDVFSINIKKLLLVTNIWRLKLNQLECTALFEKYHAKYKRRYYFGMNKSFKVDVTKIARVALVKM